MKVSLGSRDGARSVDEGPAFRITLVLHCINAARMNDDWREREREVGGVASEQASTGRCRMYSQRLNYETYVVFKFCVRAELIQFAIFVHNRSTKRVHQTILEIP